MRRSVIASTRSATQRLRGAHPGAVRRLTRITEAHPHRHHHQHDAEHAADPRAGGWTSIRTAARVGRREGAGRSDHHQQRDRVHDLHAEHHHPRRSVRAHARHESRVRGQGAGRHAGARRRHSRQHRSIRSTSSSAASPATSRRWCWARKQCRAPAPTAVPACPPPGPGAVRLSRRCARAGHLPRLRQPREDRTGARRARTDRNACKHRSTQL